ncbi:MAG: hypothetical protein NT154_44255, partial [Verrucomicrobia bacterium]|nr:hypothetical protein [Verrucomicrobiota bacterium]
MSSLFNAERQWRGVADGHRSGVCLDSATLDPMLTNIRSLNCYEPELLQLFLRRATAVGIFAWLEIGTPHQLAIQTSKTLG